jgi:lysophospholipase L1-like esterase
MRNFWRRIPLYFSILPGAILLWGFREAVSQSGGGRPVPVASAAAAQVVAPGEYLVVAVGDSLTRGAGEGPGYAADVAEHLKSTHPRSRLENLAVDGLESGGLKEVVSHPYALSLLSSARVILLSIGGNDLSHAIPREVRNLPEEIVRSRGRLEENLEDILKTLRSANPSARIVMLGLYNPFSSSDSGAAASAVVVDWNASIEKIALRHRVQTVPIFDLFEGRPDRLSPDRFHPNRRGYELIADRVMQAL